MKIAAAILTYNATSTGRLPLLKACFDSLNASADHVIIVDNGSTDGSGDWVEWLGGYAHRGRLHTSGHGTNLQARVLAGTDADILIHSDDDMLWRPGWRRKLERWWGVAPEDVAITGCHLEGRWPWNEITGKARYDGIPGYVRVSTGAASWTYRREMYDKIFPIPQQVQGFGDVPTCDKLGQDGYRICQIDLASHEGKVSTWGNLTEHKYGDGDVADVRAGVTA